MPIARFQLDDGRVARFEVPEGTTPEQAHSMMQDHFGNAAQPSAPKHESGGVLQGIGNLAAGALRGAGGIGATILHPFDSEARAKNKSEIESGLREMGAQPESMLYKGGELASEIAGTGGIGGALGKGAAALGAAKLGQALTTGGFGAQAGRNAIENAALRVAGGAGVGGASAAMINPDSAGAGATIGGAIGAVSPILGKVVEGVAKRFINIKPHAADVAKATNEEVQKAAADLGINPADIPQETVSFLQKKIADAVSKGGQIDAAALLRSKDFESLGISPLQGQITRDATQFANERNLRGVSEIQGRLTEQNKALQNIFGKPASGASEGYQAGNQIADVLRGYDASKKGAVSELYNAARGDSGRFAQVDVHAFSQAANEALDSQMLGRFLPEQARGLLNDISSGKLPLNVNNLVQVDSVLSAAQRGADSAGQKAIGVVRDALNNAPIAGGEGEAAKAAFDTARSAARSRFSELDKNPALKAISEGADVTTDFVRKHIIQSKNPAEVSRLAEILRKNSPAAFDQAKAQVADDIKRAAFGENITADTAVRPEMLAKKLRELGSDKMSAFFSAEEVAKYQTALRVASYIEKHPNAAPVNTSNTLVAQLMTSPISHAVSKVAELIPGTGAAVSLAKAASGAIRNQKAASNAMNTNVSVTNIKLNPEQRQLLAKALGSTAGVVSSQFAQ